MIDEQTILVEKLKDSAVEYLGQKLIEDIGSIHKEHTKIIEEKLYNWMNWARKYYSTTELKRAYSILIEKHRSVYATIGLHTYEDIRKLDEYEYLDLEDFKILSGYVRTPYKMRRAIATSKVNSKNVRTPHNGTSLKKLVQKLSQGPDGRKMRRLKRKEAKLKKKGIRLFDSE